MRMRAKFCALLQVALCVCTVAQEQPATASVSFTLDFPGGNPGHYEITVANDGKGAYRSTGKLDEQSDPADPAPLQFTVSEKVLTRIFELCQRAHYFTGTLDSGRKNIANTGAKTLAYKDAQQNTQATYNYSPVAPVQELTSIFEGLSTILEFGRRLTYFHKYEKLALEQDLKRMEEMQRGKNLGDIQAIARVLNEIANDSSVMNVARARAMRLMAAAGK
jgi:hypothetical protein